MEEQEEMEEIGPEEANVLVGTGAFLLDVREPDEWDAGHAPDGHHVPLGELESRLDEIPSDVTVVCVCRGGGRSARAAEALANLGRVTINLAGGMRAWEAAGLPVVSSDGPGTVI